MTDYVELTYGQVALAAILILINGGISVALRLGLERTLVVASVRTVVQLLLVGLVLEWVFQWDRWYVVLGLACLMTLVAGWTACRRNDRHYPGMWGATLVYSQARMVLVTRQLKILPLPVFYPI